MQITFKALILSIASVVACDAQTIDPICSEFQRLIDLPYPEGLSKSQLVASQESGDEYLNIDIDGDDISERIVGACPTSLQSGDPCVLSVEYSKDGKQEFRFQAMQRFFLFRYMRKIYVAVNVKGPREGRGTRSVLVVDSNEIRTICQNL